MSWFFRGKQLRPSANKMMEENTRGSHSLVLADVSEADLGNYTCRANNKIGESEATIALTGEN